MFSHPELGKTRGSERDRRSVIVRALGLIYDILAIDEYLDMQTDEWYCLYSR